jgi:hypothetical protein
LNSLAELLIFFFFFFVYKAETKRFEGHGEHGKRFRIACVAFVLAAEAYFFFYSNFRDLVFFFFFFGGGGGGGNGKVFVVFI